MTPRLVAGSAWLMSLALCTMTAKAATFPFNQFVVFGDSVSDTGNGLQAAAGFQPLPPDYTYGRFTDGPDTTPNTALTGVWHEQLANQLAIPAATASSAGGTNFAITGATTDAGSAQYPGLQTQVSTYLNRGSVAGSALYLFWGGANDLTNQTTASGIAAVANSGPQNIANEISSLAAAGGRYFLVMNMPPFDRVPSELTSPLRPALQQGSVQFNQNLATDLTQVLAANPQLSITTVDAYSLFTSMLNTPSAYGFTDVTNDARLNPNANPDTYLFWYQDHPTTAADLYIANAARQALDANFSNAPEPAPLALLGAGALAFGFGRFRRKRR